MTVHREHKVKRENQQDATNSMFVIKLSISTCFGHHYAHHQGNKTVYYCIWCSTLVVLVVVVWSWVHTMHTSYDPAPHNHNQHNQCRTPYAVIHCLVLLVMGIMMPETCWDRSLIINMELVASCWFIPLQPLALSIFQTVSNKLKFL